MDEFHRLKASEGKPGLPAPASVSVGEHEIVLIIGGSCEL
jgi:hypothetical protein